MTETTAAYPVQPHARVKMALIGVGSVCVAAVLGAGAAVAPAQEASAVAAVLIGIAGMWAALARSRWLAYGLVAILPWEGALHFPSQTVTVVKLLGLALAATWVLLALGEGRRIRAPASLLAPLVLTLTVTLSMLATGIDGTSAREVVRYWSLTLFAFLLVQFFDSRGSVLQAMRILVLSAAAGGAWALILFLLGHKARAAGPLSDPNNFGYFTGAMLPIAVFLSTLGGRERWLWRGTVLVLLAAVAGSLSRGALVGLGATLVWALLTRKIPVRRIIVPALVAGAVLAGLSHVLSGGAQQNLTVRANGATLTVLQRQAYWSAAIRISENHFLFGIGPRHFPRVGPYYIRGFVGSNRELDINSSYFEMLAENGAIAFVTFVGFLLTAWLTLQRFAKRSRVVGDADGVGLGAALQGVLVFALVAGAFFSAQLSAPFWLVTAFGACLAANAGQMTARAPEGQR